MGQHEGENYTVPTLFARQRGLQAHPEASTGFAPPVGGHNVRHGADHHSGIWQDADEFPDEDPIMGLRRLQVEAQECRDPGTAWAPGSTDGVGQG